MPIWWKVKIEQWFILFDLVNCETLVFCVTKSYDDASETFIANMSNCFSSPDDNKDEPEFKPAKSRGCTDVFWLVVYIVFWLFMVSAVSTNTFKFVWYIKISFQTENYYFERGIINGLPANCLKKWVFFTMNTLHTHFFFVIVVGAAAASIHSLIHLFIQLSAHKYWVNGIQNSISQTDINKA